MPTLEIPVKVLADVIFQNMLKRGPCSMCEIIDIMVEGEVIPVDYNERDPFDDVGQIHKAVEFLVKEKKLGWVSKLVHLPLVHSIYVDYYFVSIRYSLPYKYDLDKLDFGDQIA